MHVTGKHDRPTGPKKDWIEQPIVCTRQNLKAGYCDRRHLGDTTLRATALDLSSEDYDSKTLKPLVESLAVIRAIDVF